MEKFLISGGRALNGSVNISGAKNASLPILAATLLAGGEYNLHNVPFLKDICTMSTLLSGLDMSIYCCVDSKFCTEKTVTPAGDKSLKHNSLKIINHDNEKFEAPYDLVRTMRASILVLGPLLAKKKKARVSLPGGCAIGERPVDLHIAALEKMGANITVDQGYIDADCKELHGAEITFRTITVTGTENIMMAAVLANGTTILKNAAQEPEIIDLANFLRAMGAQISGDGTHTITIDGVQSLHPAKYSIMPDRIEAGTLLCAAAGTGGKVTLLNAPIAELAPVIERLAEAGVNIQNDGSSLIIQSDGRLNAINITTMPHPGFPTDMQAQFMAIMSVANGVSVIEETIFENRFMHVAELKRMGADITVNNRTAIVKGVAKLSAAPVMASDLRASAGLVIAALLSTGESEIQRIYHLDRGYEAFETKLTALGADVRRVPTN